METNSYRKLKFISFLLLAFLSLLFPAVMASSHYSFDQAEEMRVSGRIEWRDYGPDAFNEAIKENKPIFLLLTAPSWCYWCHVYYALGLAFPLVLFSHYLSKADRNGQVWKIIRGKELKFKIGSKEFSIHTTTFISGLLFIVLGYLIFSGTLFKFNQYLLSSSFQKGIFSIEEKLLAFWR